MAAPSANGFSALYESDQRSLMLYEGTKADVFGRWDAAREAGDYINEQDTSCPIIKRALTPYIVYL